MKSEYEIRTLYDLVELGIKLAKLDLPNSFICTVFLTKNNREYIYAELIKYGIDTECWDIAKINADAYNFKVIGINFLIF